MAAAVGPSGHDDVTVMTGLTMWGLHFQHYVCLELAAGWAAWGLTADPPCHAGEGYVAAGQRAASEGPSSAGCCVPGGHSTGSLDENWLWAGQQLGHWSGMPDVQGEVQWAPGQAPSCVAS